MGGKLAGRRRQHELGFVEIGGRGRVILAGVGQVLFGLNVFKHDADAEFFAFLCETKSFFGSGQSAARGGKTVLRGLERGIRFNDDAGEFIAGFCFGELRRFEACLRGVLASGVEQSARPDAPTQAEEIILLVAEVAGVKVASINPGI